MIHPTNSNSQHTLAQSTELSGVGLHTGAQVQISLHPAVADHGIRFRRTDLEDQPIIKADVDKVVDTRRGTTIAQGSARVSTIEHLLSACVCCGLDNLLIEIDGPEVPIMDGSALPFVEAIEQVGLAKQNAERLVIPIAEPIQFKDEEKGAEFLIVPDEKYSITTLIDFNSELLGTQYAQLTDLTDFKAQIAPARTFCFVHELEAMHEMGLVKGGDLDNALVLVEQELETAAINKLATLFDKNPNSIGTADGYLNTSPVRFTDEPARHKLLDVIGDLALIGTRIQGKIIATKPGHQSNVAFAKVLKKYVRQQKKLMDVPHYDPQAQPIYDVNEIAERIPHRYPFLLVDKIMELTDTHVVAVKNVTMNEPFFQGHFPGHPIMPGVLILEAMAQSGGVLLMKGVENPAEYVTYFLKMESVKFRRPVTPGDTLVFKLELTRPIRRGICEMSCRAYVGNQLTTEGILTAQMVKR